jgi:NAD(P)-dependent dehydrogenase (short-subunit alcohol dehydrogenase family)
MNPDKTPSSLDGKRVVVVGASSGMGLALSRLVHAEGAHVVMVSRSPDRLEEARQSIGAAEAIPTDALDEDSVAALFEQVGTLDHLVVTAVADENKLRSPLADMPVETARRGMEKFWISFFAARAAAPRLTPSGSITLTSSVSIYRPSKNGGVSVMSAASAAVATFGRSLAAELAPVRVNVLAPGVVGSGVWDDAARADLEKWAAGALPVKHLGQPEEIAHAIRFMMTNTYLTGAVVPVDGGLVIGT